ncbi:hypothetical protein H0H87_009826 [Tephrocybe sp. NHM501043]|nr:hypothetical protein H0H87_009826 [Tephrocybe sp. NHM501043]
MVTEAQNGEAMESTPLLSSGESIDAPMKDVGSTRTMFYQEFLTIPRYAIPVFCSQMLEFSLNFVPVISIGHLSTTALAAVSLGSMTANVTGASILQGLASGLDTVLPSAYTSSQPHLVGLWAQRMGGSFIPHYKAPSSSTDNLVCFIEAVVMAFALVVSITFLGMD